MIQGVWNTLAGSDGMMATPGVGRGKYLSRAPPVAAFDENKLTKYLSFGECGGLVSANLDACGLNTGFYFSFTEPSRVLTGFKIRAGDTFRFRDPTEVTIEGSNENLRDLSRGSNWKLLYKGKSGLTDRIGRTEWGERQTVNSGGILYKSYRFLVTKKRSLSIGVEYSDIKLIFDGCTKNSARHGLNETGISLQELAESAREALGFLFSRRQRSKK